MRAFYAPLLVLALGSVAACADSPIRLPVSPTVIPNEMPAKPLAVVTKLSGKGMRYVVACKVKCDVLTFPDGVVAVDTKTGPRDWTGIFAGSTSGDYEDKHFPEPFLYALRPLSTGQVTVVVIPQGYKDRSEWVTFSLDVEAGEGPRPPPPDALTAAVQAANDADRSPTKAADKAAMVAVFTVLAGNMHAPEIKTAKNLFDFNKNTMAARLGGRLGGVGQVFAVDFGTVFPPNTKESYVLTQSDRDAAKAKLTAYAKVLGEVK